MSSHGRGRIRAHERNYDDGVEIIGDGTTNLEGYSEKLRETVKLSMEDSTRKDYRRRIVRMVKFLEEKHPDYAAIGFANDVLKLPAPTNRNASRASNLKRKRTQSQTVLYPTRQER